MAYYLLTDTENSYSAANGPSWQNIEGQITQAMVGAGGRLVGPHARITRTGGLTANLAQTLPFAIFGAPAALFTQPQNNTTVAWLVEADGPNAAADIARRWNLYLSHQSPNWTGTQVWPQDERVPAWPAYLAGWQGGTTAATRTRSEFPTLTTDANENPIAPSSPDDHPTTPAETAEEIARRLNEGVQSTNNIVGGIMAVAGVGLLGYAWVASAPARRALSSSKSEAK